MEKQEILKTFRDQLLLNDFQHEYLNSLKISSFQTEELLGYYRIHLL